MRKALIGLMAAATAMTPLATAAAQEWRGRGGQQQAQSDSNRGGQARAQRSERQTVDRSNRGAEFRQRFQAQSRLQAQAQVRTSQSGASQSDRRQGFREQRQANVSQYRQLQQQQVQRRQYSQNDRTEWQRRDGERRWDGNRDGVSRTDERRRDGNWDRNRSGSWSGRTFNWSRDGRRFSWNHDWRRDRQSYRHYNRSRYHGGNYYAPYRNWSYRRFSIGFFLQPLFFGQRYWISDPWYYRLPPAYPGTRWVRYYDDVLLVDMYSGQVIDVIHNFFW